MNRRRTQASCQINKRIHLTRKQFAVFKRTFTAFVKNALTDQNYQLFLRDLYVETCRRPGLFLVEIQFDQVRPRLRRKSLDYKKHKLLAPLYEHIVRAPVPRPNEEDLTTIFSSTPSMCHLLADIDRSLRISLHSTDHSSLHSVAPAQLRLWRSRDREQTWPFEPLVD